MSHPVVRCAILGQAEIRLPGIRLTPEAELQFGLALFFCASDGRGLARDEVARLFWPDHEVAAARHCLRQALYRLRALGIPVRSGAKSTTLDQRAVEADYAPVVAEGASASDFLALSDLSVLPGYEPSFSAPFAAWVEGLRSDIGSKMRRGLVRAIADRRSRGRYSEVEQLARQCLALDPLNEEATLALVEAVILAGGKVEAMEMIERYEREVGTRSTLRIPTTLLRRRIADWLTEEATTWACRAPLVGRTSELEVLFDFHRRSLSGQPQHVCIKADAGMGKTTLLNEFLRMISLREGILTGVSCQRADRSRPLSVICELADRIIRLPGALGAAPLSLSVLRSLTSLTSGDLDGAEALTRAQIQEALSDVVAAVAEEGPLTIHIDDLQWIDPDSARTLHMLLGSSSRLPLLLVTCLRVDPEATRRLMLDSSDGSRHTLTLPPLQDADARALIESVLVRSGRVVHATLLDESVALCGGSPMFLVELARNLADTQVPAQMPTSVQALIRSRLRALHRQELAVLQACSLLGKHASASRVADVLDLPAHRLIESLSRLERIGLLLTSGNEVSPCHDAVADAVLEIMPHSAMRLVHSRAARKLEADAEALDQPTLLWQAADHSEMAQNPGDAVRLLRRLAHYLLRVGSALEAQRALQRALAQPMSLDLRWDITSELLNASRIAGDWVTIRAVLDDRDALRPYVPTNLAVEDADTLLGLEARYRIDGNLSESLPLLLSALTSGRLEPARCYPIALMGVIAADSSFDAALARLIINALPPDALDPTRASLAALPIGVIYHSTFGDLAVAVSFALEAQRRHRDVSNASISVLQRLRWSAVPLLFSGDFQAAISLLMSIYEVASERRLCTEAFETAKSIAHIGVVREDLNLASHWQALAAGWARRGSDPMTSSFAEGQAALIALCRGNEEEALRGLERASSYFTIPREGRARSRFLSLKLAVEARFIRACDDSEIEELAQLLSKSLDQGENDLGVHALSLIHDARMSRSPTLGAVLHRYAGVRRERYPHPMYFRHSHSEKAC